MIKMKVSFIKDRNDFYSVLDFNEQELVATTIMIQNLVSQLSDVENDDFCKTVYSKEFISNLENKINEIIPNLNFKFGAFSLLLKNSVQTESWIRDAIGLDENEKITWKEFYNRFIMLTDSVINKFLVDLIIEIYAKQTKIDCAIKEEKMVRFRGDNDTEIDNNADEIESEISVKNMKKINDVISKLFASFIELISKGDMFKIIDESANDEQSDKKFFRDFYNLLVENSKVTKDEIIEILETVIDKEAVKEEFGVEKLNDADDYIIGALLHNLIEGIYEKIKGGN